MKFLVLILIFFTHSLSAQNTWKLTSTNERLYKELSTQFAIQDLGYFIDEDPLFWKKADSFFTEMPLKVALEYYNDSSYAIRYYSFLKIMGENDSLAFKMLSKYISDSSIIVYQVEDLGGEIHFNQFLARAYEKFIDSKYYWCDTEDLLFRQYFRKTPFAFTKWNYAQWPSKLTSFIQLLNPWNVKTYHNLSELKHYRGVKYFQGR